jgi:hypothetical protein
VLGTLARSLAPSFQGNTVLFAPDSRALCVCVCVCMCVCVCVCLHTDTQTHTHTYTHTHVCVCVCVYVCVCVCYTNTTKPEVNWSTTVCSRYPTNGSFERSTAFTCNTLATH